VNHPATYNNRPPISSLADASGFYGFSSWG
jgi:hypothetical protein